MQDWMMDSEDSLPVSPSPPLSVVASCAPVSPSLSSASSAGGTRVIPSPPALSLDEIDFKRQLVKHGEGVFVGTGDFNVLKRTLDTQIQKIAREVFAELTGQLKTDIMASLTEELIKAQAEFANCVKRDEFTVLSGRVDNCVDMSTLKTEVDPLKTGIQDVENKLVNYALKTELGDIETKLADFAVKADIDEVNNKLKDCALNTNLAAVEDKFKDYVSKRDLPSEIRSECNQVRLDGEDALKKVAANLTSVDDKIKAHLVLFQTLKTRVETLETSSPKPASSHGAGATSGASAASALGKTLTDHANFITELTAKLRELQVTVSSIPGLQTELDGLKNLVGSAGGVDGLCHEVQELRQTLSVLESDLAQLKASVGSTGDPDSLFSRVEDLTKRVDDGVLPAFTTVNERVTALFEEFTSYQKHIEDMVKEMSGAPRSVSPTPSAVSVDSTGAAGGMPLLSPVKSTREGVIRDLGLEAEVKSAFDSFHKLAFNKPLDTTPGVYEGLVQKIDIAPPEFVFPVFGCENLCNFSARGTDSVQQLYTDFKFTCGLDGHDQFIFDSLIACFLTYTTDYPFVANLRAGFKSIEAAV